MIHLLAPHDYALARDVARSLADHLAVDAVLSGALPGQVYVDDPRDPQALLLFPPNRHRVYLAGATAHQAFNQAAAALLRERYAPRPGSPSPAEFVVYYAPGDWTPLLGTIAAGKISIPLPRQYYRLDRLRAGWRTALPPGFALHQVDAQLLADSNLQNREQLVAEMLSESPSVDVFLRTQLGMCARHGLALVGWCFSEYMNADGCELGIETLESYRRRGIALATASALIERLLARGITSIGWHCWADNAASIATASRLGFAKVKDYPSWYCNMRDG